MIPNGITKDANIDAQPVFRALADPTRRQIIAHLAQSDHTIAELADQFTVTRAAVKKHLVVLSDGGLIDIIPRGREKVNRLRPSGMAPVLSWLEVFDAFWDDGLAALKTALEPDT